jgi:hypothetical protein
MKIVYFEISTKYISTLCGQSTEILNVKAARKCSKYCALRDKEATLKTEMKIIYVMILICVSHQAL